MMRSMYAGVSGLRVHQTKMDVISNNIANINTVGFKRSTASFKDSFSQTISSASSANANKGGINPQQIGMGANVGSIATVMGQGAAQRTDYGSDLMIDGDGFFIVQDASGFSFTRAGVFEIDAVGNLVDANGNNVCGWKAVEDTDNPGSQKVIQDRVTPINIYEGDSLYTPAKATTQIEFSGNFNETTNPVQKNTMSFFDTQGNKYTIDIEFTRYVTPATTPPTMLDPNEWGISIPEGKDGEPQVTINGKEKMSWPGLTLDQTTLKFKPDGTIDNVGGAGTELKIEGLDTSAIVDSAGNPANIGGEIPGDIKVDFKTITQFNSKVTATSQTKDGNTAGNMTGYAIDGNGMIRGTYSNGETKILAQIPLANFKNPSGLEKTGNNLYKETGNSSEFDGIGSEVSALGSRMQSGALEMSNVDLSYEFSEMITTQRGFQANSRIITTSDEMIQELVNLKR